MILCALFAALIAVGAFIRVPVPMLPFTLQTFFVMLAGLLLGAKKGALSALVYLALGLLGLPIFAEGGGLSYVLKPSFGYIIGFVLGAYITGAIVEKARNPSYGRMLLASLVGLMAVYAVGMSYYFAIRLFYMGEPIGLRALFLYCFLMTLPGDVLMSLAAPLIKKRLGPAIGQ